MGGEAQIVHICLNPLKDEPETCIAHCQELDLVSLGTTEEETLIQILKTVAIQWQACEIQSHFNDRGPALFYPAGPSWLKRHEQASPIKAACLLHILETWQQDDSQHPACTLEITRNLRPVRREKHLRPFYDLVEILYSINHRLTIQQRLRLDSGVSEDYRIILGEGLSEANQVYPIPLVKTRRLSSFYVSRLLNRFTLDVNTIPELIAPKITHYPSE